MRYVSSISHRTAETTPPSQTCLPRPLSYKRSSPLSLPIQPTKATWKSFYDEVQLLAAHHPYVEKPGAGKCAKWAACFCLASVVGFCCIDPDGGDPHAWNAEAAQLVRKYEKSFRSAGCNLSFFYQRRNTWFQIDLDPNYQGEGGVFVAEGKPVVIV
jgi:hypothetical protein